MFTFYFLPKPKKTKISYKSKCTESNKEENKQIQEWAHVKSLEIKQISNVEKRRKIFYPTPPPRDTATNSTMKYPKML